MTPSRRTKLIVTPPTFQYDRCHLPPCALLATYDQMGYRVEFVHAVVPVNNKHVIWTADVIRTKRHVCDYSSSHAMLIERVVQHTSEPTKPIQPDHPVKSPWMSSHVGVH